MTIFSLKLLKTRNFDFIKKIFFTQKVPKIGICCFSKSGYTAILVRKTENVAKWALFANILKN